MYCIPPANWEAVVLNKPEPDTPHTYYLNAEGEIKSTNVDRAAKKAANTAEKDGEEYYPQNGSNTPEEQYYPQKRGNTKRSNTKRSNTNGGKNINTLSNTSHNTITNTLSNNQSINHNGEEAPIIPSAPQKQKDRLIDRSLIEKVKNQICYDDAVRNNPMQTEMVDYIVECVAQLYVANSPMMFSKVTYDPQFIHERAAAFTYDHIGYVIDSYLAQTTPISNVRSYLLTSVFNAPASFMVVEDRMHLDYVSSNSNVNTTPAGPGEWLKQA